MALVEREYWPFKAGAQSTYGYPEIELSPSSWNERLYNYLYRNGPQSVPLQSDDNGVPKFTTDYSRSSVFPFDNASIFGFAGDSINPTLNIPLALADPTYDPPKYFLGFNFPLWQSYIGRAAVPFSQQVDYRNLFFQFVQDPLDPITSVTMPSDLLIRVVNDRSPTLKPFGYSTIGNGSDVSFLQPNFVVPADGPDRLDDLGIPYFDLVWQCAGTVLNPGVRYQIPLLVDGQPAALKTLTQPLPGQNHPGFFKFYLYPQAGEEGLWLATVDPTIFSMGMVKYVLTIEDSVVPAPPVALGIIVTIQVAITSPSRSRTVINLGESVNFQCRATVTGSAQPATYLWDFDGSGEPDSVLRSPGDITFNVAGTFTVSVTATVTDPDLGTASSVSATTVVVRDPDVGRPPTAVSSDEDGLITGTAGGRLQGGRKNRVVLDSRFGMPYNARGLVRDDYIAGAWVRPEDYDEEDPQPDYVPYDKEGQKEDDKPVE